MSESCFRVPRHVTIFFYVVFREGLVSWNKAEGIDLEGAESGCNGISKSEIVDFLLKKSIKKVAPRERLL